MIPTVKQAMHLETNRLRVLMVSNHYNLKKQYPYAGVFVDRQIDSLKKAGVEICTVDIETIRSPLMFVRCWMKLRRAVKKVDPDIVHAQYGSVVGFMAVLVGRPTVISFCGHDLLPGAEMSRLRMTLGFVLSNLGALIAKALVCKSEELRGALWWRQSRAVVIPNGVDLDIFSPGSQELARKELRWTHERPVVLLVIGTNPKRKGLDLAQAAMNIVRKQLPSAELCLLHNVQPNMMPLYYRAADVLLCTSKREGSPNAVKEALACNLPVVSVPVGDVIERLKDVWPSAIVPRDPEAIGHAIVSILQGRRRSNGRDSMQQLSIERVGQRVVRVYHSTGRGYTAGPNAQYSN